MLFWCLGLYFLVSAIVLVHSFKTAYEVPSTEEWSDI